MLRQIWHFLDEKGVKFDSVFDAFSGSCVFSFMALLMGKSVVMNDVMTYPAFLASSLTGPPENCPSDEEPDVLMGPCLDPSLNLKMAESFWKDMYFTPAECRFIDSYRSNVISMYGSTAYAGMRSDGTLRLVSLFPGESPSPTEGMLKASFSIYLILTLLHQLCFTGGRFFRRQIIAKLGHRLDHIRNKGEEIYSKPKNFMWLKEIRKFLQMLSGEVERSGVSAGFHSDDIVTMLSGEHAPETDIIYLDPPYGGLSSDYAVLYRIFEEYIYGVRQADIPDIVVGTSRFKKPKGYRENLEEVLQ
jgi:adenine-specific DNA methylase